MNKLLSILLICSLLFLFACQAPPSENENIGDNGGVEAPGGDETPGSDGIPDSDETPDEEPPLILDPEMQEKLRYLIPSSWQAGIDRALGKDLSAFMFAVQTDLHLSVNSKDYVGNSIKALTHFLPLECIAGLGDLIAGYRDYTVNKPENAYACLDEVVRRFTEDVNSPVLLTFGNHDTNELWSKEQKLDVPQLLTQKNHYYQVTKKLKAHNGANMVTTGTENYYYMDFPYDNIRMIMLNTTNGDYTNNNYSSTQIISEQQVDWLKKVALDTDMTVIIASHVPLHRDFPDCDRAVENSALVREAVEQFVAEGGDFVAYLSGHTHNQDHFYDENGRLYISFVLGNSGETAEVVFVDTTARTISTVGLGKSMTDRAFTY